MLRERESERQLLQLCAQDCGFRYFWIARGRGPQSQRDRLSRNAKDTSRATMVKGKVEFAGEDDEASPPSPSTTHGFYQSPVTAAAPVPVPWKLGFRERRVVPQFARSEPARPGSASGRPMPVSVASFYEGKHGEDGSCW